MKPDLLQIVLGFILADLFIIPVIRGVISGVMKTFKKENPIVQEIDSFLSDEANKAKIKNAGVKSVTFYNNKGEVLKHIDYQNTDQ